MADIRPFKALRPIDRLAERVAALPYDVFDKEEARKEALKDPLSFLNIDRPETQFAENYDMYAPEVYKKAAEMLDAQTKEGIYGEDKKEFYYIYKLTMNGRVQNGIVACASIDDYISKVIKKHENTREEKEQDRIRHVDALSAQTGPIFLAYRHNDILMEIIRKTEQSKPIFSFISPDGIGHEGYIIDNEEDIAAVSKAFAGINEIYIADGHHRAASAVKVGLKKREENKDYTGEEEFNRFLSVLFMDDELMILPYYRVVKDLNGLDEKAFFEAVSRYFDCEYADKAYQPDKKGRFGMLLNNKWYELTAKTELMKLDDPVEALDVSILQNYLLKPVLGILDPRTDKRIDFVGGIRGLKELERRTNTDMKLAFSTYPTSISELFEVADAKLLMPPKSTWFEPKLRSGLFIHRF